LRKEIKERNIFLLEHFQNFPPEVQLGLQSGDARYLRKYWRTVQNA